MAVVKNINSFKAPPENIDLIINNRQVYYRSNMEFVSGILATQNGGTGQSRFTDDRVIIYKDGQLLSSGITTKELEALGGLQTSDAQGNPINMTALLNNKVSSVMTSNGTPLDMDANCGVKLPDYLLRTGGTITGNLTVEKDFKVGSLKITWDDVTKCVSFSVV